jgi:hypothetical protein
VDPIERREFLVGWFTLMLWAIFPFLRPRVEETKQIAEQLVDRRVFKGGEFKLSMTIKGFEVDDDWYKVLQASPELRDALIAECGGTVSSK